MEYEVKSFLLVLLIYTKADHRIEHLEDNETNHATVDNRRHNTDHLLTHLSSHGDTLTETRSLVAGTAPVDLGGGITTALARLAARFERETGMTVTLEAAEGIVLDRDVEVVVLRCAQEGLANVRKHSAASHARIELSIDDGAARVRVIDDGVGFDPTALGNERYGVAVGIRGRMEAVAGGSVDVAAAPGDGTRIHVGWRRS